MGSATKYAVIVIIALALLLTGCGASNGPINVGKAPYPATPVVLGIPVLAGVVGSGVHIGDGVVVTAAHNPVIGARKHPKCDLAKFNKASLKGTQAAVKGRVYEGEPVTIVGYDWMLRTVYTTGVYLYDIVDTNTGCQMSFTTAPIQQGMSGGPVYNQRGEWVGNVFGWVDDIEGLPDHMVAERYTIFVSAEFAEEIE